MLHCLRPANLFVDFNFHSHLNSREQFQSTWMSGSNSGVGVCSSEEGCCAELYSAQVKELNSFEVTGKKTPRLRSVAVR